jgi:phage gpG-like protein
MAGSTNVAAVIARLRSKTAEFAPSSPKLKEAFDRIGLYITGLAKLEARRQGIYDSGRLVKSLRYEFFRRGDVQGIMVGSFNVKYAAMNEFGGPFTDLQRRAMFSAMGRRGGAKRPSKGVIRGNNWRARPYLRPAFTKSRGFMIDTLRAALTFANQGK